MIHMAEEEEQKEEPKEEEPKEEPKAEGEESPDAEDMVAKANKAAARLEKANKKQEEILKRAEALKVEETLGGSAEAGTAKKMTKDEKETAIAKEYLKGTGMEDMI